MDLGELERRCERFVAARAPADPAHDLAHIKRVVNSARYLTVLEHCDLRVTLPAAWLHDCVQVPKDAPDRHLASVRAADAARDFLADAGYPGELLDAVHHAVAAHSFSAGIAVRTPEAAVVQDADRLDALGSIGIARCLLTGAALGSALYDPSDPLARRRELDDKAFMVDHFRTKLFRLPGTMQTAAGRAEAERRVRIMERFLEELEREAGVAPPDG